MPDEDDKPRRAPDRDVRRLKTPPAGVQTALRQSPAWLEPLPALHEQESWEETTDVGRPLLDQIAARTKRSSVGVDDIRGRIGNVEIGLRKLEAGHEELARHVQSTRVAVAHSDGKLDTLLEVAQAERAERIKHTELEHVARMAKIARLPGLVKALGVALAAVITAYLGSLLR
jgi:hypothetical protein